MKTSKIYLKRLQRDIDWLSQVHLFYTFVFGVLIIASRAWNLIPVEAAWQRWTLVLVMLAWTLSIWRFGRDKSKDPLYYQVLVWLLALLDVVVASFVVYSQRGIASRGLALYVLAIVTIGTLLDRTALLGIAAISATAYAAASLSYAYIHPGENYKIELYGELAFYCSVFFIIASLVWLVVRSKKR